MLKALTDEQIRAAAQGPLRAGCSPLSAVWSELSASIGTERDAYQRTRDAVAEIRELARELRTGLPHAIHATEEMVLRMPTLVVSPEAATPISEVATMAPSHDAYQQHIVPVAETARRIVNALSALQTTSPCGPAIEHVRLAAEEAAKLFSPDPGTLPAAESFMSRLHDAVPSASTPVQILQRLGRRLGELGAELNRVEGVPFEEQLSSALRVTASRLAGLQKAELDRATFDDALSFDGGRRQLAMSDAERAVYQLASVRESPDAYPSHEADRAIARFSDCERREQHRALASLEGTVAGEVIAELRRHMNAERGAGEGASHADNIRVRERLKSLVPDGETRRALLPRVTNTGIDAALEGLTRATENPRLGSEIVAANPELLAVASERPAELGRYLEALQLAAPIIARSIDRKGGIPIASIASIAGLVGIVEADIAHTRYLREVEQHEATLTRYGFDGPLALRVLRYGPFERQEYRSMAPDHLAKNLRRFLKLDPPPGHDEGLDNLVKAAVRTADALRNKGLFDPKRVFYTLNTACASTTFATIVRWVGDHPPGCDESPASAEY